MNKEGKTLKDSYLEDTISLNNHIFCFTWCYLNEVKKILTNEQIISELKNFGHYVVAFSIKDFLKNCNEKIQIIGASPVIYDDKLLNHFTVKKEKFKNQHEFRIVFAETSINSIIHTITPFLSSQAQKIIL